MKRFKRLRILFLLIFSLLGITACGNSRQTVQQQTVQQQTTQQATQQTTQQTVQQQTVSQKTVATKKAALDVNGSYTSKDDVALYINTYGKLPGNFIKKEDAQKLGWSGGSLEKYAPGKSIGGDRFGNYEGRLPKKDGRVYTECDIDTIGQSGRGAKRIVFSNDGLIYYTDDHYETFTLLYGKP